MTRVDLFVIGGGIGGMRAALLAAERGARVAIAEPDVLGGTCLNRGCIPKKALVRAAQMFTHARRLGDFGIHTGEVRLDWAQAVARKDAIVARFRAEREAALREAGVTWHRARASFESREVLRVGDERVQVDKVVLATGGRPRRPGFPGAEHTVDSTAMLGLTRVPAKLVVIGGGPIAVELACLFGHVGAEVVVLESEAEVLGELAGELRAAVLAAAPGWNVRFVVNAEVERVERRGETRVVQVKIDGRREPLEADVVLASIGREPQLEGLGLEHIGVETGERGIVVDDFLETQARGVYAIGDVHGRYQLSPIADHEARVAVGNALGGHERADEEVVPQTLFTIPAAASVGLDAATAAQRGLDVVVQRIELAATGPAVVLGQPEGFVSLVSEKPSGVIVGGFVFAAHAEEIILPIAMAVGDRRTRDQLARHIPVHPSLSELVLWAARKPV